MWIHNLGSKFKEISKIYPNNIAIYIDQKKITYRELDIYSDQIAYFLINDGLKPQDVINISSIKQIETFAIIVACWKTGIIYSVIDRYSPLKRLKEILKVCKPKLLLGEESFLENFPNKDNFKFITFEELENLLKLKKEYEEINFPDSYISYIMFTSGSTGTPNGVAIKHSSLIKFAEWAKNQYQITIDDNISGLNSLFFDNSVFDLYATLLNGATHIALSRKIVKDPKLAINILNSLRITIWFSVPSLLIYYLSLNIFEKDTFQYLKYFIFGGEGFPKIKLKELYSIYKDRVNFSNVYGPTEGTCICSNYFIKDTDFSNSEIKKLAPLGKIISNFNFYILDEDLNEVDNGDIGQLALAGNHLSCGYYNNSNKTMERFIQNPNNDKFQEIIYLTGDLVNINPENSLIYFQGRIDTQIKFMGYRIELGEIEAILSSIDGINECAVLYGLKDEFQQITCFLSSDLTTNYIKGILNNQLPTYMIPRKFIYFQELPKNANGKIDKKTISLEYYD